MKKEELPVYDRNTCPEVILFIDMHSIITFLYSFANHQRDLDIAHRDIQIFKKNPYIIEICRKLVRFGIEKPTVSDSQNFESASKEAEQWYGMWRNYVEIEIGWPKIKEFNQEVETWKQNNNFDLSKWHPKKPNIITSAVLSPKAT